MTVKGRTNEKTPDSVYNGWFDNVYGQISTAANVSPKTATFSKAAAADVTVTVTNDTPIDVQIGGETIGAGNFTVASNVVTIKKEYLLTLSNGAKPFTILMTSEEEKTVTVTVAD